MIQIAKPHDTRRSHRQRGSSSLAVLAAILPLMLIAGSFLNVVTSGHREGRQMVDQEAVRLLSSAGAHAALTRIGGTRILNEDVEYQLNGGRAVVSVSSWESDGVDNDGNGAVDDAFERGMFDVRSTAYLHAGTDEGGDVQDRAGRTLVSSTRVTGQLRDLDFAFDQAIYLDDPNTQIDFNGGAFRLSGHDQRLDGSEGAGDSRPAVGVAGSPSVLIAQVGKSQWKNIVGDLPEPAIGTTERLYFDDYRDLIAPLATLVWEDTDNSHTDAIGKFDPPVPVIAHCKGDLHVHGNTSGSGVLLVDGDLTLSGKFEFAGVILVRGAVCVDGGGAVQELRGALALWGDSPRTIVDLRVSGTVQVAYSSEAIEVASRAAGIESLMWEQR